MFFKVIRLYIIDRKRAKRVFFATRLKSNASIQVMESFLTKEKDEHILSDEEIALTGFYTTQKYPDTLRILRIYDEVNEKILVPY